MKIAGALEQSRRAYKAAPQLPGFFQGGCVSSLLGESGLPFRQLVSGSLQHGGAGVQSLGRGFREQFAGEVQLLPRGHQLLDQCRGAHLIYCNPVLKASETMPLLVAAESGL